MVGPWDSRKVDVTAWSSAAHWVALLVGPSAVLSDVVMDESLVGQWVLLKARWWVAHWDEKMVVLSVVGLVL